MAILRTPEAADLGRKEEDPCPYATLITLIMTKLLLEIPEFRKARQ